MGSRREEVTGASGAEDCSPSLLPCWSAVRDAEGGALYPGVAVCVIRGGARPTSGWV